MTKAETTPGGNLGELRMLAAILLAMLLGGLVGGLLGEQALGFKVLGELFLRALRMVVVPLIITSVITGVSQLGDVRRLGRLGGVTLGYYLASTLLAVLLGLVLVNLIQPGYGAALSSEVPATVQGKSTTFSAILLSFVPTNIFGAAANTEILPLITFSLLFGAVLTTMGEQGRQVLVVIEGLNEAILRLVRLIILFTPIGIFGLIAGKLAEFGGGAVLYEQLTRLAWYAATVIGGLGLHAGVTLVLALWLLGRRQPLAYLRGLSRALLTAFSTASSSATLPLTMEALERENRVSPRAVRFVVPLGATINMDGTALYEAVAALFIAQAYGVELTLAQQVVVALTATLASIGAAGIPEAGLVMMVLVLESVGLPLEGVGMILVIDWFLDRCRTTVNVWGDSVGAAVVEEWGGS